MRDPKIVIKNKHLTDCHPLDAVRRVGPLPDGGAQVPASQRVIPTRDLSPSPFPIPLLSATNPCDRQTSEREPDQGGEIAQKA